MQVIEAIKTRRSQLAAALNELVSDFDFYDYQDNFNPEEDIVETKAMKLL